MENFIGRQHKKSPAPIPGVWIKSSDNEINISHNKHFDKYAMFINREII